MRTSMPSIQTQPAWLMTYIALFTTLLAFFVFMVSQVEIETNGVKRDYQRFQQQLYQRIVSYRDKQQLPWLSVEMTVTKGIRLTLQPDDDQMEMFQSASDKLQPNWQSRMHDLSLLFTFLQLNDLSQQFSPLTHALARQGTQLQLQIQIEGHTDQLAMRPGARFQNNYDLSTARALRIQQQLAQFSQIPDAFFSIAGMGGSRPIDRERHHKNRRIEIYLLTEVSTLSRL